MGDTVRREAPFDIALSMIAFPHNGDGVQPWNRFCIAGVRPAKSVMGGQQAHLFLWIRLQGWDDNAMWRITDPIFEPPQPGFNDVAVTGLSVVEKRRYFIYPDTLADLYPGFDIVKATDRTLIYQPWFDLEERSRIEVVGGRSIQKSYYLVTQAPPVFHPDGLIYDGQTETLVYG